MSAPWNPRYAAYARAHGRAPEDMLTHDRSAWPGGPMCGFILWMSRRWRDWRSLRSKRHDEILSADDYADFDRWLAGTVPATTAGTEPEKQGA